MSKFKKASVVKGARRASRRSGPFGSGNQRKRVACGGMRAVRAFAQKKRRDLRDNGRKGNCGNRRRKCGIKDGGLAAYFSVGKKAVFCVCRRRIGIYLYSGKRKLAGRLHYGGRYSLI